MHLINIKPKDLKFSTRFPAYHPKRGEPTFFVPKIMLSLNNNGLLAEPNFPYFDYKIYCTKNKLHTDHFNEDIIPKGHTVRKGNRFEPGDYFYPRIWTNRPYYPGINGNPAVIAFTNPVMVVKTYNIETTKPLKDGAIIKINGKSIGSSTIELLAKNDGLSLNDFKHWFNKPLPSGQIIIWDDNIRY